MADEAVTVRDINWREAFPFTHLFRAFRIAVHPSKLVIALVALGCLWCGGLILDVLWPSRYQVTPEQRAELWAADAVPSIPAGMPPELYRTVYRTTPTDEPPGVFRTFFEFEVKQANHVLMFHAVPLPV